MKPLAALFIATVFAMACQAAGEGPITEVRVKEVGPRAYYSLKKEVKLAEMHEFAVEAITELIKKATEQKLGQGGPIMFTYHNFTGDPEQKFTTEIGLPVFKKDVEKSAGPYIRETTKFKCASAIFQGPLSKLGEAWAAFVTAAMQKGVPTGESRELYLYFENADSPNNIIELQMGLN